MSSTIPSVVHVMAAASSSSQAVDRNLADWRALPLGEQVKLLDGNKKK